MQVKDKDMYFTDAEWNEAISTPISKETMKVTFTAVVKNGGAVMVLMPDGSSIAKRMDTSVEVNEFFDAEQ